MREVVSVSVHWDGAQITVRPMFADGWTELTGRPAAAAPVQRFMVADLQELSAFGLEAALYHCVRLIGERWETAQKLQLALRHDKLWDRAEDSTNG
jgi:hypothetical protein